MQKLLKYLKQLLHFVMPVISTYLYVILSIIFASLFLYQVLEFP